jgi:hypothetical protein
LIGVVASPPDVTPRNTLYITSPAELAIHARLTECEPVPDKPIARDEFAALLAIVILAPFMAPPCAGAKTTVAVIDCPGVSVVPCAIPCTLNPAPATDTPEIVTFELPLFVICVVCELLCPSLTFPNDKLVGLACNDAVATWPVPDMLIINEDGFPFVRSVIVPLEAPVDAGSNIALNVKVAPAPITRGAANPLCAKPDPATLIWVSVSAAFPLFFSVICCESVVPTATGPNATEEGIAEMPPELPSLGDCADWLPGLAAYPQPPIPDKIAQTEMTKTE